MATEESVRILVDSRETFQKMLEFAQQYTPTIVERLHHYNGERPLFDLNGVEDEIQKALARRVDLKSGGYLIIDQTEAMTTIDVNTGGFVGGRSFDDTIFKTNLEAAQVIARQLRLRNLGGIIIIDFIDMENADHRAAVLQEFNKALDRDRTRLTVNGFTQLGLVEMTRKRTRESLAHVLCESLHDLRRPRRNQDRADRLLRDPARRRARIQAVQRPRVPHPRLAVGDRSCSWTKSRRASRNSAISSASRSRCRSRRCTRRSSTTSSSSDPGAPLWRAPGQLFGPLVPARAAGAWALRGGE